MPLTAGFNGNFTMKSGTTISADELTDWTDGVNTYTIPTGQGGPATNLATLNGVAVASFDGTDDTLQFSDANFDRNLDFVLQHFVIRGADGGSDNYVEDAANNVNRSALKHSSTNWRIQNGTDSVAVASKNNGTWEILTILRDATPATPEYTAWINDTKVADAVADVAADGSAGTGSTLGARQDFFGEGLFDLAQYVAYLDSTMPITEQEILDNIAHLNSEWDVFETGITLTITKDGTAIVPEGTKVQHLYGDDNQGTNEVLLETKSTDVNGEVTFGLDVPDGKVRFIRAIYQEGGNDVVKEQFFSD